MESEPKIVFHEETESNNNCDIEIHERRTKSAPHAKLEIVPKISSTGLHIDVSQRQLQEVPDLIFDKFEHVQYLYLEGNLIEELPSIFFPTLSCLKWLDARKNLLTTLPTNIANHANLEVLLLQENYIERLPLELGLVPKLRGVQLLGNPIEFPPADILSKGVQGMLQFLHEEWSIHSPSTIRPIEEPFYKKPEPKTINARSLRKLKSKSSIVNNVSKKNHKSVQCARKNDLPLLSVVSYQPMVDRKQRSTSPVTPHEIQDHLQESFAHNSDCPRLKKGMKSAQYVMDTENKAAATGSKRNSVDCSKRSPNEIKIYENLLKEVWISRIKKMLEKQGEILQKRKDEETLKAWRKDYSRFNEINLENLKELSMPYDIDEDYMTMLSRFELQTPSKRKEKNKSKCKKPTKSVAEEMSDVFTSLQKLHEKRSDTQLSPRTEQKALNAEIQTLANLQKRLQALKFRNSQTDVVFSLEKFNPILVKGIGSVPSEQEKKITLFS